MEHSGKTPFEQVLGILLSDATPRVWSYVASIFGDLARHPNDELSANLISHMTSKIGIKPEATRVALHRLRKEDWLRMRKSGRNSIYSLTSKGLDQSQIASKRIYGPETRYDHNWHLILTQETKAKGPWNDPSNGYIAFGQTSFFANGKAPIDCEDHFIISGKIGDVPNWVKDKLADPQKDNNFQHLEQQFINVQELLGSHGQFEPIDVAVIRSLLVHCWRRAILRYPDVPDYFFPDGWAGRRCRKHFDKALGYLHKPRLETLGKCI